ncbi:endoglucanase Y [Mycobacterium sp. JS623]|uniref:glycosyl hydrolase family 8 n=1 Tax=Mycobacterium sp. JS623 TaxID=212767 RepID=UPI0002A58CC4|nr:glycosyl hydrolase family 8 [Mycobacterium sp. JS623]AGB21264.1 endoglucanase Y [Mycobacterium sp. JS623]
MTMRRRTAFATALVLVLMIGAGWRIANAIDPRLDTGEIAALREHTARIAGQQFLDEYVESDGRVVRRDEGGDVVSEGQAYGMLIAAAVGDETRFRSIWKWTKTHLRRADGLLSWRWADDKITGANSAADADLDAARALVLAGRRFNAPELTNDGKRLGEAILDTESVAVGTGVAAPSDVNPPGTWVAGSGRILVGGNWANAAPYVVNPGYFSPRAERDLLEISADRRWTDITRTQRVLGWQLIGTGMLPPDWATVSEVGHAVPTGPVTGGPVRFGLDASRLPVRFAESCDPDDRALAGAMRPLLTAPGEVPALRNLNGSAAGSWQHPVGLVAAAATEQGVGNPDGAVERLDAAAQLEQRSPTYYGAAWVALGRIMLTTSLLGECPSAS